MEKESHNFFIAEGNEKEILELKESLSNKKDEEIVHLKFLSILFDDAKNILDFLRTQPVGSRKNILISTLFFAPESQQLILKATEELRDNVSLFIVVKWISQIIPTLNSRAIVLDLEKADFIEFDEKPKLLAKKFLAMKDVERLEAIDDFVEDFDEKELNRKEFIDLIDCVLIELRKEFLKNPTTFNNEIFGDIFKIRGYLFNPGCAIKMLFETLCFVCPTL